ncbi:syntaxin-12-like [Topomyia yanbarensis]|uniref:syntaxin-12-like n=1 Tax=Topomyia yanbarensis TaxID=2498891 RepID=UPI00273CE66E|nr:syntaxin-12-like [Topomyia yanbarensis]XP_058834041.1 syntaxin-12-like [Topomyia yanbarensis]XP_058840079.1 syntaxin-12-like [Topomyia yanbarensis]XP_058840080.1 syntaxin-12-like [Topomyia yanbarensis]
MSREGTGLSRSGSASGPRDYGATSSSAVTSMPAAADASNFGGFSPTEFISLSESIAANTIFVKQSWQFLEKANRTVGTQKDNQTLRDKVHEIQTGTNQRISTTSKDLQRLTIVVRRGDKQQKLQVEKLTSDFTHVVQMYYKNQQVIAAKMKQVLLVNASQQDDLNASGFGDSQEQLHQRQQQQLQQSLQFEQDMLLEREMRFRQIEADVLDVNQIMAELSSLTNLQGEVVDTIENTIEHTVTNVESGATELAKAAEYQNKYRRKVIYLLILAVILGLIVTGIIVSRLKS